MKTYIGVRTPSPCVFVIENSHATVLIHLGGHSDDFEWGYRGSGPMDLATSLLADAAGVAAAARLAYEFKRQIVASWQADVFSITEAEIAAWAAQQPEQPEPVHVSFSIPRESDSVIGGQDKC